MGNWRDRIAGENAVLLFFLGLAVYMYVQAGSFQEDAAKFPQLTASVVVIGIVLLLAQDHLPGFMQDFVSDEAELMDTSLGDGATGDVDESRKGTDGPGGDEVDRRVVAIPSTVFTTATISAYVLFGYLFGLLWVTPLYVVFYMWWYKLRPWQILLAAGTSTVVVYLFIVYLYVPFDRGVLLDLSWLLDLI